MPTIYGIAPDGKPRPAQVDADGKLVVTGVAGGGGGSGDASATNQTLQITAANLTNTRVGDLAETAPTTDTASSGLNGRLQRIAQRLSSLITLWTAGPGTEAAALRVTLASDGPGVTQLTSINSRLLGATSVTKVNATAGASLTALAAGACRMVFVNNNRSGAVDLEWDLGSGGTEIIAAGSYRMIDGITNAAQIRLRRADGVASSVTVSTELRS